MEELLDRLRELFLRMQEGNVLLLVAALVLALLGYALIKRLLKLALFLLVFLAAYAALLYFFA